MWEKCRGVPLGPERVEVEPFENGSKCWRVLFVRCLSFSLGVFLKGFNPPIKYRVSPGIGNVGSRDFA